MVVEVVEVVRAVVEVVELVVVAGAADTELVAELEPGQELVHIEPVGIVLAGSILVGTGWAVGIELAGNTSGIGLV